MRKKWFLFIFLFLLLAIAGYFLLLPKVIEIKSNLASPAPETENPITLLFAGDIMLDRGVTYQIEKQGNNDFRFPFLKIASEIQKADLAIANLESQISDKGIKVGSIYSFRANPKTIEGLTFAGFDILGLANNHAFDYGKQALSDSINRLLETNINPVGAGNESQAFAPAIKTVKETTIAIFAYTDQGPETWQANKENIGVALVSKENLERVKADISLAKKLANIVIVSFHSGQEYQTEPTETQISFSRAFIDAGADIVVCHHSHVIQPEEKYKDGYIFYGLGNFVFDQGFSPETMKGKIVEVVVEDKKIKRVLAKEIKINEFFQPELIPWANEDQIPLQK